MLKWHPIKLLFIFFLLLSKIIFSRCIELKHNSDILKIGIFGDTRTPLSLEKLFGASPTIKINHIPPYLIFLKPHILLHTGDLVKIGSKKSDWQIFRKYFKRFINFENQPVLFPVPGNHDLNFIQNVALQNYFETFPYLNHQRWYCLYINNILILNLDSNFGKLSKEELSKQNLFIEATLKQYSDKFDLLLVNFHHPVYKSIRTLKMNKDFKKNFYPVFESVEKYIFFINGHFHNFFYHKIKEKTFLIISGGAGAPLHKFVPGLLNKHHLVIMKIYIPKKLIKIKILVFKSPARFYFKTIDKIKY